MNRRPGTLLLTVIALGLFGAGAWFILDRSGRPATPVPLSPDLVIPRLDLSEMQPAVREVLARARERLVHQAGSAEAWGEFGAVCEAHRLFEQAERSYERARTLAPRDVRWPYLLAAVREGSGSDPASVVALLEEAAALEPSFPPVQFSLGQVRMRQGDLEGAVASYRRAIELDGTLAIAHRGLGQALLLLDRLEEARHHLERAASLGPEDRGVFASLAQVHMRVGDEPGAQALAARAARVRTELSLPDPIRYRVESMGVSSRHCHARGTALMRAGEFELALDQLEVVAGVRPDDPEILYYRGVCLARLQRVDEAVAALDRAVALRPDLHTAQALLGSIHAAHGRRDAAIAHLEAAVREAPSNDRYRAMLAEARGR